MRRHIDTRGATFIVAACFLLVCGLVVEFGLARPRMREIDRLVAERGRLLGMLDAQQRSDDLGDKLASYLGVADLGDLNAGPTSDATTYLGALLERSKLVRLSLTTAGSDESDGIRRTDFTLRAQGGYANLQQFVRDLESGSRLASVGAFDIQMQPGTDKLEGRFNISIYDPAGKE